MIGIEVVAFAGALIDVVAKSHRLVERYKDTQPRKRQLLDELQATSAMLLRLQDLVSNTAAASAINSPATTLLYGWFSRCQATQHDIEAYFSTTFGHELGRKRKMKLAANRDLFIRFEDQVRNDRDQLVALL